MLTLRHNRQNFRLFTHQATHIRGSRRKEEKINHHNHHDNNNETEIFITSLESTTNDDMDPQLCNTIMEENQDDDDDDDDPNSPSRHVSAAGVVRGVSRSIARSIAKPIVKTIPKQVPKISKQLFTRRGQLRVKGVAKVSDRLSTGWEVYSSVKETVDEGSVKQKKTRSWVPAVQAVRTFTAS